MSKYAILHHDPEFWRVKELTICDSDTVDAVKEELDKAGRTLIVVCNVSSPVGMIRLGMELKDNPDHVNFINQIVDANVELGTQDKDYQIESLQNKLKAAEKSLQSIYGACYKASQAGLIVTNGDKKNEPGR